MKRVLGIAALALALIALLAALYPRPTGRSHRAVPEPADLLAHDPHPAPILSRRAGAPPGVTTRSLPGVDPYAGAELMAERREAPGRDGIATRTRLVRVDDFKYPLIRVEEQILTDGTQPPVVLLRKAMVGDHVLVVLRAGADAARLAALAGRHAGHIRRSMLRPDHYLVAFADADLDTVPEKVAALSRHDDVVAWVEPDGMVHAVNALPNDPEWTNGLDRLWGLRKSGVSNAWKVITGEGTTVVGVIDSGVDHAHPDLAANMWINPGELSTPNGIDDDGNGLVDDIHGYNFYADTGDPMDDNGHGTHVAGTIGAVGNNATGVVGMAWTTRIMGLKFLDGSGNGATSDAIDALEYTTLMLGRGVAVRLTNNSWGGWGYSGALRAAIADAAAAGQLFVAAAGNYANDNDLVGYYPASYDVSNILSVAHTTPTDTLYSGSHYGATTVDLAAPGSMIYSTLPGDSYGLMSGTSMSSPHVAGAAVLLWDLYPEATWQEIYAALMGSVDPLPALVGRCVSEGRLNIHAAIASLVPRLIHVPLVNSIVTNAPITVTATIDPVPRLASNALYVAWNTNGSTNSFTTNLLVQVASNRFETALPAQSLGTELYYYVHAAVTGHVYRTSPSNAPTTLHHFEITPAVTLTVTGHPSPLGTVEPAYGVHHTMPSGLVVNAMAPAYLETAPAHRYACTGWQGSGDVPGTGVSHAISFTIRGPSVLEWQWQSQVRLIQEATPSGMVDTVTWWPTGSTGQTIPADAQTSDGPTTYHFVEWQVDSNRWPDATSVAANPAVGIGMVTARVARALYLPSTQDTDADGLPDWWERHFFGALTPGPLDDSDSDGYSHEEEWADGTDPRDAGSVPMPPVITHTFLSDPQPTPAPWEVGAAVTDNHAVADVTLHWRRVPRVWQALAMLPEGGSSNRYSAVIATNSAPGERYAYYITAVDTAGNPAQTVTQQFELVYPVHTLAPTNVAAVLQPGQISNVLVTITNHGNTNLVWSLGSGWLDDMEQGDGDWEHSGSNDRWHRSYYRAHTGAASWYCGDGIFHAYDNSMDARLDTPPLTLGTNATLRFWHWAHMEHEVDDYYWDGGILQMSTNGGASFFDVEPVGGYPHRITDNTASPFPADTPCFGGDGTGWSQVEVDLSAYAGATAIIRFRFGSDGLIVEEGWYIDDVSVAPLAAPLEWLGVPVTSGTLAAAGATSVTATVSTAAIATGDRNGVLRLTSNDPVAPRADITFTLQVRSPPQVAVTWAGQTSRDGSGHVSVSNQVWDVDGQAVDLAVDYRVDATWVTASVTSVSSSLGSGTIDDPPGRVVGVTTAQAETPQTNHVTFVWDTTRDLPPLELSTSTWVRVRAWDGVHWSPARTSQPFLVDNEAPGVVSGLTAVGYSPGTWWTQRVVALQWQAVSDGDGIGMEGYALSHGIGVPSGDATVDTVQTNGFVNGVADGTNWWLGVRPVDHYGNAGPMATTGPVRVDATPPDASGANVSFTTYPGADYVLGNVVTGHWVRVTDNLSGIAEYRVAWTDLGGTTGGTVSTGTTGILADAVSDTTNTFYLWAVDEAGLAGAAYGAPILVLAVTNDFDTDGQTTAQELLGGSDPADAGSQFGIESATRSAAPTGAAFVVEWQGLPGRAYTLEYRPTLSHTSTWEVVPAVSNMPGLPGMMRYTDAVHHVDGRFYRLTVSQP